MNKITFDSGVQSYKINGCGVLRFNPSDPNVYARFMEAVDRIRLVEEDLLEKSKNQENAGEKALALLHYADQQMKKTLSWVFGPENDFDQLLGGVNLLAVASNGERVVTNLFAALQPILLAGAESVAQQKAQAAVIKANARRAGV